MTTEHVSVPRASMDDLHDAVRERLGHDHPIAKRIEAILSRATPSESDFAIHMDRDAWRAAMIGLCQGAMSDVGTPDKAADHLRKRLAKAKPSAPRVVTDELVQLVADDLDGIFAIEDIQEPAFLADVQRIVQRIADELATSLPAAIPPGYVVVPIEPTKAMCDAYMQTDDEADHSAGPREVVARDIYKAMLSAAPQAGETK